MLELPAVNWAPRRMLPPPMTMAISTPSCGGPLDLGRDVDDFLHADAALAGGGKAFAGEFQQDSFVRAGRHRSCNIGIAGGAIA